MKEVKENDKSYHPPETIKLDYCATVLAVVLREHPQAKVLFENIKDCTLLPGVQETFNTVERKIPGSDDLIKGMVTKAGYSEKSKPDTNSAIAARKLITGTVKLIVVLKNRLYIWIIISNKRRRDVHYGSQ
jgi:hypothetical protein